MYTKVIAVGRIKNLKKSETSKGEPMVSFLLNTFDSSFPVRLFGEPVNAVELENDNIVVVEGRLKAYNQQLYVLAEGIKPLKAEYQKPNKEENKYNKSNQWHEYGNR